MTIPVQCFKCFFTQTHARDSPSFDKWGTLRKRIESRPSQNPAAQTTGLFSLPPGTAGAAPGANPVAAVQNPLAALQSSTGNPLLDAYSQYAALAAAGYTAAQAGHNGLDMSQQQHQQTGD